MGEHVLPFHDTAAMAEQPLADYYSSLFASGQELLFDERTGLYAVWRHSTVKAFLEFDAPDTDAISNKTTLDSLTDPWKFALNPGAWPSLAHLIQIPRATANATDKDGHRRVRQAIIRGDDALSLGPSPVRQRYGRLVHTTIAQEVDGFSRELASHGIADFAPRMQRISAEIISKVLGFTDSQDIKTWADAQTNILGRNFSWTDWAEQAAGLRGLANLSRANRRLANNTAQAMADKRCPRNLMANMLSNPTDEPLEPRLAAAAGMNLIAAGYSTTYGTALNGIKRLLADDNGRMYWRHMDDKDLSQQLVNEVIRVETALVGWERYTEKDVRLSATEVIPRKSRVLLMLGAANRDPHIFGGQANAITIDQARSHAQLSFGGKGADSHYCVGAGLAKLELSELFQYMSHAMPDLRVADTDPYEYDGPDYKFRTPTTLLLTQ